jgi:uracil-DNA glycosylase
LIVGQAPVSKVHQSGIPWNDASGDRLRDWLKLDRATFYDAARVVGAHETLTARGDPSYLILLSRRWKKWKR